MVDSDPLNAPATGTSSHSSKKLCKILICSHCALQFTFLHRHSVLTVQRLSMLILG